MMGSEGEVVIDYLPVAARFIPPAATEWISAAISIPDSEGLRLRNP